MSLELDYCSQRRTKKEARHERCFINSSAKVTLPLLNPCFTPALVYRLNPQNGPSAAFDPAADDPVIRLGRQHERLSNLLHCNRMSAVCLCSAPACVLQEFPPLPSWQRCICRAVTGCRRKQEHHCSSLSWQVQSRHPHQLTPPEGQRCLFFFFSLCCSSLSFGSLIFMMLTPSLLSLLQIPLDPLSCSPNINPCFHSSY